MQQIGQDNSRKRPNFSLSNVKGCRKHDSMTCRSIHEGLIGGGALLDGFQVAFLDAEHEGFAT